MRQYLAELYHIGVDPGENHTLINDPQHADKIRELKAELGQLLLVPIWIRCL